MANNTHNCQRTRHHIPSFPVLNYQGPANHTTKHALVELVETMQSLCTTGLVHHTAGNAAYRLPDGTIALTPTALPYEHMTPNDIVITTINGDLICGHRTPTSEKMLHLRVLADYPEFAASIHCHAKYASMFAVDHHPIPCVLEEFAVHIGGDVRCAEYQVTGSNELAQAISTELSDRSAVLMANHGLFTAGPTLAEAAEKAALVERTAEIVWGATQMGRPEPLPPKTTAMFAAIYQAARSAT